MLDPITLAGCTVLFLVRVYIRVFQSKDLTIWVSQSGTSFVAWKQVRIFTFIFIWWFSSVLQVLTDTIYLVSRMGHGSGVCEDVAIVIVVPFNVFISGCCWYWWKR